MTARRYAAVDLGASSGRVMVGAFGGSHGGLTLTEAHRFRNEPIELPDGLHWDAVTLYRETIEGLRRAGDVRSAGIDTWGVDYGLIDERGALLGLPYHYRDARTANVPPVDGYRVTGIQHLPFNTVYQLRAEPAERRSTASAMLLMPDLLGFWLTGAVGAERTNASTTALIDARTGLWSPEIVAAAGIEPRLLPPLREPGTLVGHTATRTGLDVQLVAVASHDTASAVLAVPAATERFAYIATGTWSLAGIELDAPVLSEASRAANFTNEAGVDGTIRYLRNVMGLWLLQECQRAWHEPDTAALVRAAADAQPFRSLIDPDHESFLAPGDMPARIAAYCRRTGQPEPDGPAAMTRCVLESLALGHRSAIADAMRLSGREIDAVHLVGGGVRNELLCALTADACGLPVIAGPVEATALGNVLAQARADGGPGDRWEMRALVAQSTEPAVYQPRGDGIAWQRAAERIGRR